MSLLFVENLSPRLVALMRLPFPGCQHVELLRLRGQSDLTIWELAAARGLTIVSKDNDFRQLSFLKGPPPKVVWLSVGNAGTERIADLLGRNCDRIAAFESQPEEGLLVLELGQDVVR